MPRKISLAAAGVLALASVSSDAAVLPYRFDKVAQHGPGFSGLGLPALNDSGVAAYAETRPDGSAGVFFGNHFGVQQVPTIPGGLQSGVDINNAGQVAFARTQAPPPGQAFGDEVVYRADPTGIVRIGSAFGVIEEDISAGPVVNNAGVVGFSTAATIQSRALRGDGSGPPQIVGSSAGTIAGSGINNAGNLVYASISTGGTFVMYNARTVVAAANFGQSTSFTDPDTGVTGPFTAIRSFDVGDNDRVAFGARWNNLGDAIYLWENGALSRVAGTTGLTGVPAINDLGVVAGLVSGTGPTRLSIFEAGVEGTLISVGTPFDGSTVTGLNFSPEGFNNLNQVAFQAFLADGRTVNVIGQLPEPGAPATFLLAGTGFFARRRPRRLSDVGG